MCPATRIYQIRPPDLRSFKVFVKGEHGCFSSIHFGIWVSKASGAGG